MQTRSARLAALAASLLTFGCAPRVAVHPSGGAGWVEVTPPGAGIAAQMPGRPTMTRGQRVEDDGTPVVVTTVRSETGVGSFSLIVADFEGGTVGDPILLAHTLAEGILGELHLSNATAERLDLPGFYVRQDVGAHQQGVVVGVRQYVGARRIYVAIAAVPQRPDLLAMADHFMESIRVDPADRLYPAASDGAAPWGPVYSPGESFAVEMPAVANVETTTLGLPSGEAAERAFEGRAGEATYRVRVIAFADPSRTASIEEVAAALSLGDATGPTQASGFPGRAHHAAGAAPIDSRVFRTAGRIYVLETTGAAPDAARFFDSFRIL